MDPNLDDNVNRLMSAWSKTFKKMHAEIMQHPGLGITGPQYNMLSIISKEKSCNVTHLSEMLEVKPSAITVMIDRLVQNGYVDRRHDEQDRRAVLLTVTADGAEKLKEARKRSHEVLKYYLSHIEQHELEILVSTLEKFAMLDRNRDMI
jgi:DNA-binding MarR family transcriptional regulator